MNVNSIFRRRGFSVLELLVAIAIIAVLAVLSVGGLGQLKESSNGAGCVSNLRQIGVLFSLYLGEHNMFFPPTSNENQILVGGAKGSYSGYNGKPSTRPLNQYTNGDYSVFKCPSDVGYRNNPEREAFQPVFVGQTYFSVLGSSYRYNAKTMGKGSLTKVEKPVDAEMYKLSDIQAPSRFIVMGDSDLYSYMPGGLPRWYTRWHGVRSADGDPNRPIANALFADWHVETITVSDRPSVANFGDNYHFDVGNKR